MAERRRGTGGKNRGALSGRGPTPRAEQRTGHPAARRRAGQERRGAADAGRRGQGGRDASGRATSGRSPLERGARGGGAARGARSPRGRDDADVVLGRNAVLEALRAKVPAAELVLAEGVDVDDRMLEISALAARRALPVSEAPRPSLDRRADGLPHQGVLLVVPPYHYADPSDLLDRVAGRDDALLVALDQVEDPHNLGSVVRSAAALGAQGVVVPERRSAGVTPTVWRTSAGALAHLPVARAVNLTRWLVAAGDAGLVRVGLDGDASATTDDLSEADGPLVLVVGAEGRGLSRLVRETCDRLVAVPTTDLVESLNAGVATGVVLAEVARRRRALARPDDGPAAT